MKNIFYLSLCMFLSGCASVVVSDLSKESKYSEYIGHDYPLNGKALICKDGYLGDASRVKPKGDELKLSDRDVCHYGEAVAKVPKGTLITIDKAQMHHHIPPLWRHIYLIGHLTLDNDTSYGFYYFYGFEGDENAKPPW